MIFIIHGKTFPQEATKIFLQKKKVEGKTLRWDYEFENQKDSLYIDFRYSGDFGLVFHVNFKLRDHLPDGKYEVYVDKILVNEAYIKNGLKNGLWAEYNDRGEKRTIPYDRDTINGYITDYYEDGLVRRITNIEKGNITWRETYSQEKVIQMKEIYRNQTVYKILKYNQKGDVIEEKHIP
jgi:antitoxin component YwqK of YwqJK toxin-antitoxin module